MKSNRKIKGALISSLKEGSTDPVRIEAYYDAWANQYDQDLESWNYNAPTEVSELLLEKVNAGSDVLDVGCGTGLLGDALTKRQSLRLTGIDLSKNSLQISKRRGCYSTLKQLNLQSVPLPFENDTFDAAVSVGVLTYIPDAAALLSDLCRIVKPTGYIIFTHRDDRWKTDDFDSLISKLQSNQLCHLDFISSAKPYLPKNAEFADRIKAIYASLQVK